MTSDTFLPDFLKQKLKSKKGEIIQPKHIMALTTLGIKYIKVKRKPKIIFIGLQEGEKIYEELVLGNNLVKTKLKNILSANEIMNTKLDYSMIISKLKNSCFIIYFTFNNITSKFTLAWYCIS